MSNGLAAVAAAATSAPSPWLSLAVESLGAIGSAGAAAVAVWLAARQIKERREAQAELAQLRERDARAQAVGVVTSVEPQMELGTDDVGTVFDIRGCWRIRVHNTSGMPIRAVRATVWARLDPAVVAGADVADVIAPGEAATVITGDSIAPELVRRPDFFVFFRDAHEASWRLDTDGELVRLD